MPIDVLQAVSSAMQKEQLKKLRAAMELMRVQGAAAAAAEAAASAKTVDDAAKKSFEFWRVLHAIGIMESKPN